MKVRNLLLAIVLALVALPAHAQHPSGRHRAGPVEKLLRHREELRLTEEQVARLADIDGRMEERNRPIVERLLEIRRKYHSLPRVRRSEMTPEQKEQFRKRVEEARPLMEQIRKNNREAMEEVGEMLTAEQKAQLRQIIKKQGEHDGRPGRAKHHHDRGA